MVMPNASSLIQGGQIVHLAAREVPAPYLRPVPSPAETGAGADPTVRRLCAAHPLLGTLAEADRRALLQRSRIRTLARREIAFWEGDPATCVVLVLDGYVRLSQQASGGNEVFLDIAGPGTCLGDLLALHRQPHDATITALSAGRLLLIDARHFRQAFERRTEGLLAMLQLAGERLRRGAEHLAACCALPAPARLARALLRLAERPAAEGGGMAALQVRLSQSELAMMTGVCREMINKQLRGWLAEGLVELSGGAVTSIRSPALRAIADEDIGGEVGPLRCRSRA